MVTSFQVGIDVGIDSFKRLPGAVALPPIHSTQYVSQRHEVSSAIALNLLKDIQSAVSIWQEQLRQIVAALHVLHAQGPMVDGWLESSAPVVPADGADSTILRHGDAAALIQYVESLDCDGSNHSSPKSGLESDLESDLESGLNSGLETQALPTYRLCHLSANGQVMSQPCPAEQMGMVSMAIARYQKFRQLMNKKQAIEARLQRAVDELTGTRSALKGSGE
ncbi:MAG: hypothetical protein AAF716_19580 [Cyanobacteria bacterium P01_D01_bin.1]